MKRAWLSVGRRVFNATTESTRQAGSRAAPRPGLQHPGSSAASQQELRTGQWEPTADNSPAPGTHFLSLQTGCYRPAHLLQPRNADTRETRDFNCSLKVTRKPDLRPKVPIPQQKLQFRYHLSKDAFDTHRTLPCAFKNHS